MSIDPYGTHCPLLAGCLAATMGPVLELGAGWHSTPLLHAMCGASGRKLLTIESNKAWMDPFTPLFRDHHKLLCRELASPADIAAAPWGVVLVDQAPAEDRMVWLAELVKSESVGLVVAHDAANGKRKQVLERFRHYRLFKFLEPWTAIASNTMPIPELLPR